MRGLILYPSDTPRESNAFDWFKRVFAENDIEVEIGFFEDFKFNEGALPSFVLMRGYESKISSWIESKGVRVINSTASMEDSRNKITTARLLEALNIPTPKTYYKEDALPVQYNYKEISDFFHSSTFIFKEISGSKGEGVYLIEKEEDLLNAIRGLTAPNSIFAQEYISSSRGRDVRVWIVGGRVVDSVLRYNENSFKSNFAQGGSFKEFDLPVEAAKMAIAATAAVGLDISGVDLLFLEDGFTVCEVNGNAGFRTAKVDIPAEVANYVQRTFFPIFVG